MFTTTREAQRETHTTDGSMTFQATYYEILGLPSSFHHEARLAAPLLRRAYKRALLQNHPDKSATPIAKRRTLDRIFSVDDITRAYTVLGDPKEKARYDNDMRLRGEVRVVEGGEGGQGFRTGLETVDLDDLEVDEGLDEVMWWRGCRCGDERGFEVREGDLELAADAGEAEVVVGCRGCSLWLKVLFGVVEDEEEEEEAGGEQRASTTQTCADQGRVGEVPTHETSE